MSGKLTEEIGRNYHTIENGPYTWEDYSDSRSEIYANEEGGFSARVTCLSDDNLSTNLRNFPDEGSAQHWAREQAERIRRKTLNEFKILRNLIKNLILEGI